MSDAKPAERGVGHPASVLLIFSLTVAWIGGTIAFLVAAYLAGFCLNCQISEAHRLTVDRLVLGSLACACGFPLLAALVCGLTGRKVGAGILVILGVSVALVYGMTAGVDAVRDIQRIERPTSVPAPTNNCPCLQRRQL